MHRRIHGLVALLLCGLAAASPAQAQTAPAAGAQTAPAAAPAARPAAPAAAQPAPRGPRPGEVETAPIRCWWKTDTAAVRIGERFTVTLTCGVIETSSLTVSANTTQLDPGAVQLTPFEVVAGTRHDDIVAPPWRYFQYEYRVRLLSEGFFGQDLALPGLPVTYNIKAAAGGESQGRDQKYLLPPLPMRVMSLVPKEANDIRDASAEGFGPIEARRARATTATVAAIVLFAFAAALLALALMRALGLVRARQPRAARPLAPVTVLGACLRALEAVRTQALRDGWSPELARRGLTALRLAGAVALGRPMAQVPVDAETAAREGQLLVRQGLWRPRRLMVSASTTAHSIERALDERGAVAPGSRAALDRLRDAIAAFSVASYGRRAEIEGATLDGLLAGSTDAIRQLRRRSLWPMKAGGRPATRVDRVRVGSLSEERL